MSNYYIGIDLGTSAMKGILTDEQGKILQLGRQIFANVLGIPVHILASEQGPSYGAAILAMVGCGVYSDVAEATKHIVVTAQVLYPQQEKVLLYNNKYLLYKQLYPALKRYFEATKND